MARGLLGASGYACTTEPVGLHVHGRADANRGRHGIPSERDRHVLNSNRNR